MNTETKKCKDCLIEKSLSCFYNRSDRQNKKRSICIECHGKRRIQRYKNACENIEYKIEHAKKSAEWRNNNIAKAMYSRAKNRAKNKNLPFDLSIEDINIPEFCPILGIKLEHSNGIASDNSPSIDRINSDLGYTKNNIIVCSYRANRIKNDSSIKEIEMILKWYNSLNMENK